MHLQSIRARWATRAAACLLFPAILSAVELPVEDIHIGPDSAEVLRHGLLGADAAIEGLPAALSESTILLAIDGPGPQPQPRMTRASAPPQPVDPELVARHRELEHLQQRLRDLASQRRLLDAMVGVSDDRGAATLPDTQILVPAERLDQLMGFIATAVAPLDAEQVALEAGLDALRSQIAELERQRVEAVRPPARLQIPGAAGRTVTLIHPQPGLRWAPSYRVSVREQAVLLHRDVLLEVDLDRPLTAKRLFLHASNLTRSLQATRLQVTELSVSDEAAPDAEHSSETARSTALRRHSLGRASESAVEPTLNFLVRSQNADGSWGDEPHRLQVTALAMLSLLGSGYDHRTPSRYRKVAQRGIEWLQHQTDKAEQVSTQALITMTLAEAFALSNDPSLEPVARAAAKHLSLLVVERGGLPHALSSPETLAGPTALFLLAAAEKSLRASTIELPLDSLRLAIRSSVPTLAMHRDRDWASMVGIVVELYLGTHQPELSEAIWRSWSERIPEWIEAGRLELLWIGSMACFQLGGDPWQVWNDRLRDRLLGLQRVADERGDVSSVLPHPLGPVAAISLSTLAQSVYYRYLPLKGGAGLRPPQRSLANPRIAAAGWPLVLMVEAARIEAGRGIRHLAVDDVSLPGAIELYAVPASSAGVWRVLRTRNPLPQPLAAGTAELMIDGRAAGSLALPFVAPGAALRMDLGRDERYRATRHERSQEREVAGRRVRSVTVELQVFGPDGRTVLIEEAIPRPESPDIRLNVLEPAMDADELDRAMAGSASWQLPLIPEGGVASATLRYELRYPANMRLDSEEPKDAP